MDPKHHLELLVAKGLQYDLADEERLLKHFWAITYSAKDSFPVVYTTIEGKLVQIHRFILNVQESIVFVDHRDGNRLDNRRKNLRLCNNQQNCMNQKPRLGRKYKGTAKLPSGMYRARVTLNGKHLHLGTFITEELAALAYNEAAIEYYGEFARLNVLEI